MPLNFHVNYKQQQSKSRRKEREREWRKENDVWKELNEMQQTAGNAQHIENL